MKKMKSLSLLRQKLFSSTADKVRDEEKEDIITSGVLIILDPEQYNKLPEPADNEIDMLDSAFGLTETWSHLGCQIIAKLRSKKKIAKRNFAVDGHKPKPH